MSDGELVRQTRAGWAPAYEELVRRWAGRITAICHAKTGRAEPAEDLAQEVLLRGYRALSSLADQEKFGAWLCGIAVRTCLDWLKAKRRAPIPFSALSKQDHPADHLCQAVEDPEPDRQDEVRKLMSEVEALPEEYREVLMLYYYEDVTYKDLAEMLEVSTATINARLTKARAMLRQRLTATGEVRHGM